jgi:hypothetical protein
LEFTVMNASQEYLDIAPEDLEIVEDGVVQKVDTFQEAVEPVSMVMAIDSSGSMVKSTDAVKQAARDFVAAVRPEDSLALITFADNPVFAHMLGAIASSPGRDRRIRPPAGRRYGALWCSDDPQQVSAGLRWSC